MFIYLVCTKVETVKNIVCRFSMAFQHKDVYFQDQMKKYCFHLYNGKTEWNPTLLLLQTKGSPYRRRIRSCEL